MSAPVPAPSGPSWYDADDAPARTDLNVCIHCGLCLTACPTYRTLKTEPDSPRGRIYLMKGLAEGRIGPSDELVGHLDLCLGCRACEPVCPAGVPYGRMLEEARGQLERRATRQTPLRSLGHWALKALFRERGRLHLAADFLRLGQIGPVGALLRSRAGQRLLPAFARRGLAMTPRLAPRAHRRLERVAEALPAGARMERTADGLRFHPAGTPTGRVAFFTTCVMDVMFPHVNREAVRLLVLAGLRVDVPRAQTCCGALHAHAGLRHTAKDLARTNAAVFADPGYDAIVTDSAGCGAALRDMGHLLAHDAQVAQAGAVAARVRDVSQVLAAAGMPPAARALHSQHDPTKPLRVGYHDPCHLAHAQGVRAEPRNLLAALPGVELVDLPRSDWCCGSAGVYNLTHPDMAQTQLEQKLDSIAEARAEVVVASNPGCQLHMARGANERGMGVPVVHLVEILGRAYPAPVAS